MYEKGKPVGQEDDTGTVDWKAGSRKKQNAVASPTNNVRTNTAIRIDLKVVVKTDMVLSSVTVLNALSGK